MKVRSLEANDVHGYLPLRIDFFPDLTFLTGLNGSGKTSALRLLMGLLAPNLEELASIAFSVATVTVVNDGAETTIIARRTAEGLTISVGSMPEELTISAAELQLLVEGRRRPEDARSPVWLKIEQHGVYQAIVAMATPMFLGLDRRFYFADSAARDTVAEYRRREAHMRRIVHQEDFEPLRGTVAAGLADVNMLVQDTMQEIRAAQERLDNNLRNQLLLSAFTFKTSDMTTLSGSPSRASLEKYRKRQAEFEKAAAGLRLPLSEVQSALNTFFERMNAIAVSLEQEERPRKRSKARDPARAVFDWIVNKPQADRVFDHLSLLEKYSTERTQLHEPIDRFVKLVNAFLTQTGKHAQVSERGYMQVLVGTDAVPRSIGALSSGERQIVVMLAHLALNRQLAGSGVFIVDEPELSLHISWQERFVDAIREANPGAQLILATHSPAIIMDRDDNCRDLSEIGN